MAKELPYFKFTVAEWLTGDIVYESFSVQGLFINICALYWQREGNLSLSDINKRFKESAKPTELAELSARFFSFDGDQISIKFLDEQFQERKTLSKQNAKNVKKRWDLKASDIATIDTTVLPSYNERNTKRYNIEKRREEKRREDGKIPKKVFFKDSEIFEPVKFKEAFPNWEKDKLRYYWDAAERYSSENHKYIDWKKAIDNWAKKDELEGKIKFKINKNSTLDQPAN